MISKGHFKPDFLILSLYFDLSDRLDKTYFEKAASSLQFLFNDQNTYWRRRTRHSVLLCACVRARVLVCVFMFVCQSLSVCVCVCVLVFISVSHRVWCVYLSVCLSLSLSLYSMMYLSNEVWIHNFRRHRFYHRDSVNFITIDIASAGRNFLKSTIYTKD